MILLFAIAWIEIYVLQHFADAECITGKHFVHTYFVRSSASASSSPSSWLLIQNSMWVLTHGNIFWCEMCRMHCTMSRLLSRVVSCHWVYGGSHITVFIYKTFTFIVAPGYLLLFLFRHFLVLVSLRQNPLVWSTHWWWLHIKKKRNKELLYHAHVLLPHTYNGIAIFPIIVIVIIIWHKYSMNDARFIDLHGFIFHHSSKALRLSVLPTTSTHRQRERERVSVHGNTHNACSVSRHGGEDGIGCCHDYNLFTRTLFVHLFWMWHNNLILSRTHTRIRCAYRLGVRDISMSALNVCASPHVFGIFFSSSSSSELAKPLNFPLSFD